MSTYRNMKKCDISHRNGENFRLSKTFATSTRDIKVELKSIVGIDSFPIPNAHATKQKDRHELEMWNQIKRLQMKNRVIYFFQQNDCNLLCYEADTVVIARKTA